MADITEENKKRESLGTIENVYLLDDKLKAQLTPFDIFDKVINLRFITGQTDSQEETDNSSSTYTPTGMYVLRSDYEPVFFDTDVRNRITGNTNMRRYYIRKCIHKPSIRIDYKLVADSIAINLDIYIDNFYMMSSDGRQLTAFTIDENPIREVQIMMGYFGQFKDVPHETLTDLFNFTSCNGVDVLNARVEFVYTDGTPPNGKVHLVCKIAQSVTLHDEDSLYNLESADYVTDKEARPLGDTLKISYDTVIQNLKSAPRSTYKSIEAVLPKYDNDGSRISRDNPTNQSGEGLLADAVTISGNFISKLLDNLNNIRKSKGGKDDSNKIPSNISFNIPVSVDPLKYGIQLNESELASKDELGSYFREMVHKESVDSSSGVPSTVNGVTRSANTYASPTNARGFPSTVEQKNPNFSFSKVYLEDIISEVREQDSTPVGSMVSQSILGNFMNSGNVYSFEMMKAMQPANSSLISNEVKPFDSVFKDFKSGVENLVDKIRNTSLKDLDSITLKALLYFCPNVVLSDGVKELLREAYTVDSNGEGHEFIIPKITADTIEQTVTQLRQAVGTNIRVAKTCKGDYLLFTDKEAQDITFLSEMFHASAWGSYVIENSQFTSDYNNVIPAVYSVDFGATCTMHCPFFSFVNPFQKLLFSNRYVNGSLVQYYTNPSVADMLIYAIQCSITFATVDDVNEMQIVGVRDERGLSAFMRGLVGYIEKGEEREDE